MTKHLYRALAAFALLLALAATQAPTKAAAACVEAGGYPFVTDGCLPAPSLNAALTHSRGPTPPGNTSGDGALQGYIWIDSSTTPETWRVCQVAQCTGGVYHSSEWGTVGTFAAGVFTPDLTQPQPAAWRNLGIGSDIELDPSTLLVTAGGGSNAVGDKIGLTCSGATAFVAPKVNVAVVSGGAVTKVALVNRGVFTSVPAGGTTTCTQASTTGSGSGLTITFAFRPVSRTSIERLAAAGGSGNFFATSPEGGPHPGLYGTEDFFEGWASGACVSGAASGNTGVAGFWAGGGTGCPLGVLTGSYNTCVGDDSLYNAIGNLSQVTCIGQDADRNGTYAGSGPGQTGSINLYAGQGAGSPPGVANTPANTSDFMTVVGPLAGQGLTSTHQATLIGAGVAPTLANGADIIAIGDSSNCDVSAGNASNEILICGVNGIILHVTGTGTPSSSLTDILGTAEIAGGVLQIGGTTSGFPELRNSGSVMQFRLGDNSDYATIDAGGKILGVHNASVALTGDLGEQMDPTPVGSGSGVSLANSTPAVVTTVNVTIGDWLIYGNLCFGGPGATTVNYIEGGLNANSSALPGGTSLTSFPYSGGGAAFAGVGTCFAVQPLRYHASTPTAVNLVAQLQYNTGSGGVGYGEAHATRLH